jgi:hypothetical protein
MKQTYTLFILLLLSYSGFCQTSDFTLTFEDSTVINQVFYTDSILDPAGIWQIGKPNKPFFDSGYASTNAVVTLLDSAVPAGSKASFIVSIPSLRAGNWNGALITFASKLDLDSGHSGAYVEFSIDSGIHWHGVFTRYLTDGHYNYLGQEHFCVASCNGEEVDGQIISPPTWYQHIPQDTTSFGVHYFTGTDSTWIQDTIAIPAGCILKTSQLSSFLLKFSVFTDSASALKAGWMIDSIHFNSNPFYCIGGINSSHLTISPNPAESGFSISLTDQVDNNYSVTLLDLTGREVMSRDFTGREVTLHREGLAAGSYIVKVTNSRTQDTFEKRITFE